MDPIYWIESYGPRDSLVNSISDAATKNFADVNYGPWDRLDNNAPFVAGVGARPPGANLYPKDITKAEFEALRDAGIVEHVQYGSGDVLWRRAQHGQGKNKQ